MTTVQSPNPEVVGTRFIGRQPIFRGDESLFGYELLFRSGKRNLADHDDGEMATAHVMDNSINGIGLARLSGGRRAFINLTEQGLLQETYQLLPQKLVVIELLETVRPTPEVIAACRRLKRAGYALALDDLTSTEGHGALLDLADLIKIDFGLTQPDERETIVRALKPRGTKLLAEKVETREQFQEACDGGFDYFQGYFFQEPEIISFRDVPTTMRSHLSFLQEVNKPEINFTDLEQVIQRDMGIATKLLRYLNSAHFGLGQRITSIHQALVLLGEVPLRKWASVLALSCMAVDRPPELVTTSLTRARFCQQAGTAAKLQVNDLALFMLGLLSLIDAVTSQPLDEVLMTMPVPREVRAALLGSHRPLGKLCGLVQCCERADERGAAELARSLGLTPEQVWTLYGEATTWADGVFRE